MAKIISIVGYKFLESAFSIYIDLTLEELIHKSIQEYYNTKYEDLSIFTETVKFRKAK